ncbi:hypothetical protein [Lentzea sp. E54]|uniref:hypothetical protein n=1 Tax=Lentzea xerophila TaxID=3435883 RepID=UPI003DA327F7
MPENVRLVMLCRTERIELLKPPAGTPRLQLTGFTLAETHRYLDTVFDFVSEPQADEFHRRTGGNPRIQAFAVETSPASEPRDPNSCLLALGEPLPGLTANLDDLLQNRLDDRKNAHPGSGAEIDRLCEALSALRPRIPARVLSALCGISEDAVHSFVQTSGDLFSSMVTPFSSAMNRLRFGFARTTGRRGTRFRTSSTA